MSQRVQSYHLEYNEIEDEVNKFKRFTDGIDRLRNLINPYVTTKRYTYSIKEWQHILDLRYYGTTGKPHPNCHIVMQMVKDQINNFAKEHNIYYQV